MMTVSAVSTPCQPAALELPETARTQVRKPAAGVAAPARASDPLNLSGTAVAARALAAAAPVDDARVAGVRAAIAAGTYKVDPQAIAAKMIALDLPGR